MIRSLPARIRAVLATEETGELHVCVEAPGRHARVLQAQEAWESDWRITFVPQVNDDGELVA